mgnify:CR=1 FL=1|tara:strand:- start:1081 stop:1920 length:840 start_codon:yes stop_codon:yes gene_type:complete
MDSGQRSGILILLLALLIVFVGLLVRQNSSQPSLPDAQVLAIRQQIDSLKQDRLKDKKDTIYPFNPNYITDYRGYVLGLSVEEIDKLHAYRESNKWINSASDFKKVTGVADSTLEKISPYFKFPSWVTSPKPKNKNTWTGKAVDKKGDLNLATVRDLMQVDGVTEDLAKAILNYRKKYGGFVEEFQLYDVDALSTEMVRAIRKDFTVKTVPHVEKMNVNTASASDLATLPFIKFYMARDIVDYRDLHEGIDSIAELKKIRGITSFTFDRIKLYLATDQK